MPSVAERPDVKETVEQVMSGELFSGLLIGDVDQRALALEALLGRVVDDDTRIVWVGNPLRSALTIERLLIQIAGPEIDLRLERSPAELAGLIARRVGHESRVLIVVQQPETIDARTRDLLVEIGGSLGGEAVHVQFLFAGSPAFALPQLEPLDVEAFSSRTRGAGPPDIEPVSLNGRRHDTLPLRLLLALTIGVMFWIAPTSHVGMPSSAPAAAPDNPVTSLQREFNAFTASYTPPLPPMTESEKDALFHQFLTHHRRE